MATTDDWGGVLVEDQPAAVNDDWGGIALDSAPSAAPDDWGGIPIPDETPTSQTHGNPTPPLVETPADGGSNTLSPTPTGDAVAPTSNALLDAGGRVLAGAGSMGLSVIGGLARLAEAHPQITGAIVPALSGVPSQVVEQGAGQVADISADAASRAKEDFGVDPSRDKTVLGKTGDIAGGLITIPAMIAGGLPLMAAAAVGGTKEAEYQKFIAEGATPEEAQHKSDIATAIKAPIQLGLYAATGYAAKFIPGTSAVTKFAANAVANVVASAGVRGAEAGIEGNPVGEAMLSPTLEGTMMDIAFAAHPAYEAYKARVAEAAKNGEAPPEPAPDLAEHIRSVVADPPPLPTDTGGKISDTSRRGGEPPAQAAPAIPVEITEATSALSATAETASEVSPLAAQEAALLAEAINARAAAEAARVAAQPPPNEPNNETTLPPESPLRPDVPEQRDVPALPEQPAASAPAGAPEITAPEVNLSDQRFSESDEGFLNAETGDDAAATNPATVTPTPTPAQATPADAPAPIADTSWRGGEQSPSRGEQIAARLSELEQEFGPREAIDPTTQQPVQSRNLLTEEAELLKEQSEIPVEPPPLPTEQVESGPVAEPVAGEVTPPVVTPENLRTEREQRVAAMEAETNPALKEALAGRVKEIDAELAQTLPEAPTEASAPTEPAAKAEPPPAETPVPLDTETALSSPEIQPTPTNEQTKTESLPAVPETAGAVRLPEEVAAATGPQTQGEGAPAPATAPIAASEPEVPLEKRIGQAAPVLSDAEIEGLSKEQRKTRTEMLKAAQREAQAKVKRMSEIKKPDVRQRRVLARATESRDAAVDALTDLERVQPPAPAKRRSFTVANTGDTFTSDPVVNVVMDNGGLMSKSTARQNWSAEKFAEDKGIWDEAPSRFAHPTHNAIYKPNGLTPDEALTAVKAAGLLDESAQVADLWRKLNQASTGGKSARDQAVAQKANEKIETKQSEDFEREAFNADSGEEAHAVDDLNPGDEIKIGTETMKVTAIDADTGDVTMEDGKKFGIQLVENGRVIYGEKTAAVFDPLADWPELDSPPKAAEYIKNEGIKDENQPPVESIEGTQPEEPTNQEREVVAGEVSPTGVSPAEREAAHLRAYELAQRIGEEVARGQSSIIKEAATLAALKNAQASIEGSPDAKFNPDFMRKSAMSAAGREAKRAMKSIDEPTGEDGPTKLDLTEDESQESPAIQAERADLYEGAQEAMKQLSERERAVVQGIANGDEVSEIAEELGITRQAVDRIQKQALAKLNKRITEMEAGAKKQSEKAPVKEKIAGTRAVAQRVVNAEEKFISFAMETGGLTREQAETALARYRKDKAIKIDPIGGQYSFTNGGFAEAEVLRRAAGVETVVPEAPKLTEGGEFQPPKEPDTEFGLMRGKLRRENPKKAAQEDKLDADYEKAFADWLSKIPENKAIIFRRVETFNGKEIVSYQAITRDPSGAWRTTSFDSTLEMPIGHEEFKTRLEAAQKLKNWERIEKLPFTVKAGEFHGQRTPHLWLKEEGQPARMVKFGGYLAGGVRAEVMDLNGVFKDGAWEQVSADDLSLPSKGEAAEAKTKEDDAWKQLEATRESDKKAKADAPKLTPGEDQGALLAGGDVNTGTTANVTNEDAGTLVRVGGQVVAKLNQNAKGEFVPALNEQGTKLTAEQKATVEQAATDYTKTWRAAEVRRLSAKPKSAADLTTQLDMLESGRSESPLFEQKDALERLLEKGIENTSYKPGELLVDPLLIKTLGKPLVNAALRITLATYRATKSVAKAIEAGMAHIRANATNLDEEFTKAELTGFMERLQAADTAAESAPSGQVEEPSATVPPEPPEGTNTTAEPPPVTEAPPPPVEPPPTAPEPPSPPAPSPSGIRNAIVDQQRVARGLPERMAPLKRTFGQLWERAMAIVDADPSAGTDLVNDIARNPRPLEDWESALLAHEQVTRENVFDRAIAAVNDNPANAEAKEILNKARTSVMEVYDAGQRAGTESGRSLAARKLLVNEDFSLAKMETVWRAEVNGGKPLTEDQAKLVQGLHDRIAAADAKVKEFEAAELVRENQKIMQEVLNEQRKARRNDLKEAKKSRKTMGEWAASAEVNLMANLSDTAKNIARMFGAESGGVGGVGGAGGSGRKMGQGESNALDRLSAKDVANLTALGAVRIAKGLDTFAKWSASMVETFGEAIAPILKPLWPRSREMHKENTRVWDTTAADPKSGAAPTPTAPAQKPTAESILANAKADEPLGHSLVGALVRARVEEGVGSEGGRKGEQSMIDAVTADVQTIYPDATESDVRQAFSRYGEVTYPSREAVDVQIREFKALSRIQSQLEDAQKKLNLLNAGELEAAKKAGPQRTGPQRDKATAAISEADKEVKELTRQSTLLMRKLGIESETPAQQLKTSLDAIKTRLTNQIAELTKQIETRTKPEGKTPVPYDAEATALRAERDRLAGLAEEIFGKPELTDVQRIAAATKSLDRSIAEEDALLKAGILKRPAKESKTPVTPELEAKRAMLDSMRDLRRELAEAENPKQSPEERALEAAFKAAGASLARYDAMLKSGNLTPAERAAKFTPTTELETLWNERNAVRDAVAELRREAIPRKPAEELARLAALKALDKRMADLDRRLKTGDFSDAPKTARAVSADVEAKRAERDAMLKLYRDLKKAQMPKRSPEEIQLARDKKLITARTAELQRRVREGDYAPKPKKAPVMDAEKETLLFEQSKAKQEYFRGKYNATMAARPALEKALGAINETLGLLRALKVGFDNSAVGRQGRWVAEAHPLIALKALPDNIRSALSDKAALAAFNRLKKDADFQRALQAKVQFVDPEEVSMTKVEEEFQSRWINALPRWTLVGPGLRASQRAFNAYMNNIRLNMFKALLRTHEAFGGLPANAEEIRNYGKMTNIATGRGEMGKYESAVQVSNTVLFATRFYVSRVQALALTPMWEGNARTRSVVALEYARMLTGKAVYYGIMSGVLSMLGMDDDDDGIIWNPLSSNFGKIKAGNTYIDPWAGEAQWFTVFSRLAMGEKVDQNGKTVSLRGDTGFAKADIDGTALKFLETKRSPNFALIHDYIRQKHYGFTEEEKEWTIENTVEQAVSPLLLRDTYELMTEHGVPKGTALWLLLLHGESMQTRQ